MFLRQDPSYKQILETDKDALTNLIDAFDRLVSVFIFVQIESVSDFFSFAFRDAVNIERVVFMLVGQALITLSKSSAAGIKRVYWLAVPASGNVMRALG